MIREDNSWIIKGTVLCFLLIITLLAIAFVITISIDTDEHEPELNYTVGRCVEWNLTYNDSNEIVSYIMTDLGFQWCVDLEHENISCVIVPYTENSINIYVKNKTCINNWYTEDLNFSELMKCTIIDAEGICINRMIMIDEW